MITTRLATYEVIGENNNYLWLEVLEGADAGIRVSVPKTSNAYNDKLQQKINDLSEGDVCKFKLVSKDEQSPNWVIAEIDEDSGEGNRTQRKQMAG